MKNILLFGSGNVSFSIVSYFCKEDTNFITIATNDLSQALKLSKQFPNNSKAIYLDIKNSAQCLPCVQKADIVISMIPPILHHYVVKYCIESKTDMVCASYLKEDIRKMHHEAEQAGITIIFEMGLDPGIDHIVTMKMIEEARKKKGIIKSLVSLCGGLISPECIDNPMAYKFSWSPIGVFRALSNAIYLENDKLKKINKADVLYHSVPIHINNSLNTVTYPNRDSLKYKSLYKIEKANSIF